MSEETLLASTVGEGANTPTDATPPSANTPVDPAVGDTTPPVVDTWTDGLLESATGGDTKLAAQLKRYKTPAEALKAGLEAQKKLRSGGGAKSMPKPDAPPEELAAWREENGIPSDPAGYDLALPEGVVLGEADTPLVDAFREYAHKLNMPASQVSASVKFMLEQQAVISQQQLEADLAGRGEAESSLKEEFGANLPLALGKAQELLTKAPEEVQDLMKFGRMPDGSLIGNNPEVVKWLAVVAQQLNPNPTVAPSGGRGTIQSAKEEIASLESMMGNRESEYWKGPKAKINQARAAELYDLVSRNKG